MVLNLEILFGLISFIYFFLQSFFIFSFHQRNKLNNLNFKNFFNLKKIIKVKNITQITFDSVSIFIYFYKQKNFHHFGSSVEFFSDLFIVIWVWIDSSYFAHFQFWCWCDKVEAIFIWFPVIETTKDKRAFGKWHNNKGMKHRWSGYEPMKRQWSSNKTLTHYCIVFIIIMLLWNVRLPFFFSHFLLNFLTILTSDFLLAHIQEDFISLIS